VRNQVTSYMRRCLFKGKVIQCDITDSQGIFLINSDLIKNPVANLELSEHYLNARMEREVHQYCLKERCRNVI
jgi:hypothetical protein